MTAVSDLLDGLEAAAKAATPGLWGYCNEIIGTDVRDLGPGSMSYKHLVCYIRDDDRECYDEPVEAEADAACIVAEHNAAPVLVAALRAVLALADNWDQNCSWITDPGDRELSAAAAASIRAAVSSALGVSS